MLITDLQNIITLMCTVMFVVEKQAGGLLSLYPSEVTQICVGQQFEITCSTNETGLIWDLDNNRNSGNQHQLQYFFFSSDPNPAIQRLQVGSSMFTFARNSTQNSSPLVSSISVVNASTSINAAKVNCTELIMYQKGQVESTAFYIIGVNHTGDMNTPSVMVMPQFYSNRALVLLEWTAEEGVSYEVTSIQAVDIRFIERSRVQLIVLYNTAYNISVVANKCGRDHTRVTTTVDLNYAKCDYPLWQLNGDDRVTIIGYVDPALKGDTVSFSCSSGLVLNGSNTSTCMGNGEWEPHPRDIGCLTTISNQNSSDYFPHPSTQPEIKVTFFCQEDCFNEIQCPLEPHTTVCNLNGTWQPSPVEFCSRNEKKLINDDNILTNAVILSISALLVSSLIVFIIGFVCGWYFSGRFRRKSSSKVTSDTSVLQETSPIYEDTLPKATQQFNQEFELDKNVAYGPIKH